MQEQNFCVVFTQDLRMPHLHATQGETSKNINASARNLMLCVYITLVTTMLRYRRGSTKVVFNFLLQQHTAYPPTH
jgi:hypothetical protein